MYPPKIGGYLDPGIWSHPTLHCTRNRSCFCCSPTRGTTFSQPEEVSMCSFCPAPTWLNKPPLFRQVLEKQSKACKLRVPRCWESGSWLLQQQKVLAAKVFLDTVHLSESHFLLSCFAMHRTSEPTLGDILLLPVSQNKALALWLLVLTLSVGSKQDTRSGSRAAGMHLLAVLTQAHLSRRCDTMAEEPAHGAQGNPWPIWRTHWFPNPQYSSILLKEGDLENNVSLISICLNWLTYRDK